MTQEDDDAHQLPSDWFSAFTNHNVTPTSPDTPTKYPYQLDFLKVEGLPTPRGSLHGDLELRVSFFDFAQGAFFGRTWGGGPCDLSGKSGGGEDGSDTEDAVVHSQIGHWVTIHFKNQCVYFHTPITSPDVVVVVEFVFQGTDEREESIGGGWTFFHCFDPERGGLSLSEVWDVADDTSETDDTHIIPIYTGTPRILPFLSSVDTPPTLPGAALTFAFTPRSDLRGVAHLWKENVFVGEGDRVPGVKMREGRVRGVRMNTGFVSEIRVYFHPTLHQYDAELLHALTHMPTLHPHLHPTHKPTILERRLHIGFHNTHTFLNPTTAPLETPDNDTGLELVYTGTLGLQYLHDPRVALVVGVEYKVFVPTVKEPPGFLERVLLGRREVHGMRGVEKVVMVGWMAWVPSRHSGEQARMIPLHTKSGPNPFGRPMYKAQGQTPLLVSFVFHEKEKRRDKGETLQTTTHPHVVPPPETKPTPHLVDAVTSPLALSDADPDADIPAPPPRSRTRTPAPAPSRPPSTHQPLTRLERARIHEAGFPPTLDDQGRKAAIVSLDERVDLDAENQDLRGCEIGLSFLGVMFYDELDTPTPHTLRLTYQFYTFAPHTTPPLRIYTGPLPAAKHQRSASAKSQQAEETMWPGIFWAGGEDGTYAHPPGHTTIYPIHPTTDPALPIGTYTPTTSPVALYMSTTSLDIDLWDASTLLHVGRTRVPLQHALRRGRSGVYADLEVDVVNAGVAKGTVVGRLYVRVTNVVRGASAVEALVKDVRNPYGVEKMCLVDWILRRSREHVVQVPFKLSDIDAELSALLRATHQERLHLTASRRDKELNMVHEQQRKMDRVKRVKMGSEDGFKVRFQAR
ncbi:uncharacterized protein SPPG_02691 [Spizellomyces punctatus DAOM BR117]|uniref:NPHP4 C2-like domain-containing protein n=1 Tax=Spizellomyces punctatus (strain DAOM BR117) TaxID=645134 RepID=A0A0L0HL94_SPIPD|nr:uncharacterized protein SPPG_02691 [Spizellomyces punctatus DAOM BR117]KND02206.1 hypothetical protein SPPG_02691 [Spizellomyces punctatus DAOM BR117]|eukprot:XP_016610245.1 hypothetical protein SPPG_02691 [Spizellomyces punctatus DAOM BR117]